MTDSHLPSPADRALGEFITELIECGGVLSQMVAAMADFERSGHTTADALPIPEAMHSVISSALHGVRQSFSKRDLLMAARIVKTATNTICEEVYAVDPQLLEEIARDN